MPPLIATNVPQSRVAPTGACTVADGSHVPSPCRSYTNTTGPSAVRARTASRVSSIAIVDPNAVAPTGANTTALSMILGDVGTASAAGGRNAIAAVTASAAIAARRALSTP